MLLSAILVDEGKVGLVPKEFIVITHFSSQSP